MIDRWIRSGHDVAIINYAGSRPEAVAFFLRGEMGVETPDQWAEKIGRLAPASQSLKQVQVDNALAGHKTNVFADLVGQGPEDQIETILEIWLCQGVLFGSVDNLSVQKNLLLQKRRGPVDPGERPFVFLRFSRSPVRCGAAVQKWAEDQRPGLVVEKRPKYVYARNSK